MAIVPKSLGSEITLTVFSVVENILMDSLVFVVVTPPFAMTAIAVQKMNVEINNFFMMWFFSLLSHNYGD
jgi:hypothetical protein